MRIHDTKLSRAEYLSTQIARSEAKFSYCKVSVQDVGRYADVVNRHRLREGDSAPAGPIVCLGSRNGREIDLFRSQFFGSPWRRGMMRILERRTHSFTSWFSPLEGVGRSSVSALSASSVVGVELNPRAARSDVWVGSFDAMPPDWSHRFSVAYSNSFDQSEDPDRTAREWGRIVRPRGYVIFCFSKNAAPTLSDPVGGLTLEDVLGLFGGELVYFCDRGSRSGYSEVIMRMKGSA